METQLCLRGYHLHLKKRDRKGIAKVGVVGHWWLKDGNTAVFIPRKLKNHTTKHRISSDFLPG